MSFFLSNAELDELCEGLIRHYEGESYRTKPVDIEGFAINCLGLKIYYVLFAEEDMSKLAFLADGETALAVYADGKSKNVIFPPKTILLDRMLKDKKETGRRRFCIAHEVQHYLDGMLSGQKNAAGFHNEFDAEREYTIDELRAILSGKEWAANRGAAALLMPKPLLDFAVKRFVGERPIILYGANVLSSESKRILSQMADFLGVSMTALLIRLKHFSMTENRELSAYITDELHLKGGGNSQ